jgi:hypothetical protein
VKTFRAAVTHKKETTWGQERVLFPQVISRQYRTTPIHVKKSRLSDWQNALRIGPALPSKLG